MKNITIKTAHGTSVATMHGLQRIGIRFDGGKAFELFEGIDFLNVLNEKGFLSDNTIEALSDDLSAYFNKVLLRPDKIEQRTPLTKDDIYRLKTKYSK